MDETRKKKHVREPPSVPFIWEVKPGIPKKDWKPQISSVDQFPKTPLKQIASVPFVWEEKPGKPLPKFSHVSVDHVPPKPHKILIHVASSSGYSIACNYGHDDDKHKESSIENVHQGGSYNNDSESITSLDFEAFSFDADESFSSVPSLLANCLVSSTKIATAIPLQKNSLCKRNSDHLETPSSPASSETDSSTSSYATGRSSPIGATFLECLFPLYPPKSGFLERDEHLEQVSSSLASSKDFDHEDCVSDMVRRPPTLGELIMMSRRSYGRKAVQMKKWDPPKKITRKQAFGCFSSVTSSHMIEALLKRKYFPRLKMAWSE
ncbi:uncharacterized protein LOC113871264 [Abrus precatorius]|uniref:Uncharacterized protein LOC113871264 n=1 Tax=Abrus precatorius TaxID=3816 RepID=A0A8B8M5V9_ABRPR|nr:uncharacterized protein LOC113871264 [Abrus precatorius]